MLTACCTAELVTVPPPRYNDIQEPDSFCMQTVLHAVVTQIILENALAPLSPGSNALDSL